MANNTSCKTRWKDLKSKFLIENLFTNFINLSGDRRLAEDEAIICGFGIFEKRSVCIIGQEKWRGNRWPSISQFWNGKKSWI